MVKLLSNPGHNAKFLEAALRTDGHNANTKFKVKHLKGHMKFYHKDIILIFKPPIGLLHVDMYNPRRIEWREQVVLDR